MFECSQWALRRTCMSKSKSFNAVKCSIQWRERSEGYITDKITWENKEGKKIKVADIEVVEGCFLKPSKVDDSKSRRARY